MLHRRKFIGITAAATATSYFVNPTAAIGSNSPNERLNIACVGATNRAGANIAALKSQNIAAIADIDSNLLEKGCAPYAGVRKYNDFRVMLEKEADRIDAVVVGTPDHTHAPAAAMAMRLGKHCYCEKPLAHTVKEARVLSELATAKKLKTQMGTQIHSLDNYRRVVEAIQGGMIGDVKEAHVWSNARYSGAKFETAEKPRNVDWDLWLGPAVDRPYSKNVHPFNWRRFWDYGTGALGDFGCHFMDLTHWALKLKHPDKITSRGEPLDPVTPPDWCIVDYEYPAREKNARAETDMGTNQNGMRQFCIAFIATFFMQALVSGDDWPQWRGSNRDGIWAEDRFGEEVFQTGNQKKNGELPLVRATVVRPLRQDGFSLWTD